MKFCVPPDKSQQDVQKAHTNAGREHTPHVRDLTRVATRGTASSGANWDREEEKRTRRPPPIGRRAEAPPKPPHTKTDAATVTWTVSHRFRGSPAATRTRR